MENFPHMDVHHFHLYSYVSEPREKLFRSDSCLSILNKTGREGSSIGPIYRTRTPFSASQVQHHLSVSRQPTFDAGV